MLVIAGRNYIITHRGDIRALQPPQVVRKRLKSPGVGNQKFVCINSNYIIILFEKHIYEAGYYLHPQIIIIDFCLPNATQTKLPEVSCKATKGDDV